MDQQWVDVGSPWIKKKVQFLSAELKCLESDEPVTYKKIPLTRDFFTSAF
jgi:hypothetical protein